MSTSTAISSSREGRISSWRKVFALCVGSPLINVSICFHHKQELKKLIHGAVHVVYSVERPRIVQKLGFFVFIQNLQCDNADYVSVASGHHSSCTTKTAKIISSCNKGAFRYNAKATVYCQHVVMQRSCAFTGARHRCLSLLLEFCNRKDRHAAELA